MTDVESTAPPTRLAVYFDDTSHSIDPGRGVVTIGRGPQADVQIDDHRISRTHLKVESANGQWRIVDASLNGMFVDGLRKSSITVTGGVTVRLGDPVDGKSVTFDVVGPASSDDGPQLNQTEEIDLTGTWRTDDLDPGVVRAGAAAAARRRSLDISQRSLAADEVINAGALIAFEKGRSWPRERTRARLEEVFRWPAGTIARIREGAPVPGDEVTEVLSGDDQVPLIARVVVAAVDSCSHAVDALPPVEDPNFPRRVAPILADLRRLEAVAVQATRIGRITPALIKALSTVRRNYEQLMLLGATSPGATLGQRLYAARRRANLSVAEIAQAGGITEDVIVHAEAEDTLPAGAAGAIESLISQISWG